MVKRKKNNRRWSEEKQERYLATFSPEKLAGKVSFEREAYRVQPIIIQVR